MVKIHKIINRQKPWRETKNWKFPYKVESTTALLRNPQYIKDRQEIFHNNGNGWWCKTPESQRQGRRVKQ